MLIVLRIAVAQIKVFFYNPVAWLMFIVFAVQASMLYLNGLDRMVGHSASSFTSTIFIGTGRIFDALPSILIVYVPLLTMGLIAREVQTGSIKLLQSSPVGIIHLVTGKYLAVITYFFLPVLFLLSLILLTSLFLPNIQFGLMLTATFGIYTLMAVYAAIGMFISSITSSQVVSAVVTIAIIGVLSLIGILGQRIPIVNEFAYWLSISDRMDPILSGLIVSKDIVYFAVIIILFLSLTFLRLSAGRKSQNSWATSLQVAGLGLTVALVGAVSSLPRFSVHYDSTFTKNMSLSSGARDAIQNVVGSWRVTVFINALDVNARLFLPRNRNWLERFLLDQYLLESPHGEIKYVWYYGPAENPSLFASNPGLSEEELARRFAYRNRLDFDSFLEPEQVEEFFDVQQEEFRTLFLVENGDRSAIVRTFDDSIHVPDEVHFASAFKQLAEGNPSIAYVVGQGERRVFERGSENHRRRFGQRSRRGTVINLGFNLQEITLQDPVPEDIDILVLAAPTESYPQVALTHLDAFLERGGNGIVYVEPNTSRVVKPILDRFGIDLVAGQVSQNSVAFGKDVVFTQISGKAEALGLYSSYDFSEESFPMGLVGAGALRAESVGGFSVAPAMEFVSPNVSLGDEASPALGDLAPAIALRREKNGQIQKWLIVADADFQSSGVDDSEELSDLDGSILYFNISMWTWLNELGYPVDTGRKSAIDSQLNIEQYQVDYLRVLLYGILPSSVLLLGAAFLLRRRSA